MFSLSSTFAQQNQALATFDNQYATPGASCSSTNSQQMQELLMVMMMGGAGGTGGGTGIDPLMMAMLDGGQQSSPVSGLPTDPSQTVLSTNPVFNAGYQGQVSDFFGNTERNAGQDNWVNQLGWDNTASTTGNN
ncbi:MAG TPA: hypothetical protein VGO93_03470, partial [Candidatus Xenobia bacterium]